MRAVHTKGGRGRGGEGGGWSGTNKSAPRVDSPRDKRKKMPLNLPPRQSEINEIIGFLNAAQSTAEVIASEQLQRHGYKYYCRVISSVITINHMRRVCECVLITVRKR